MNFPKMYHRYEEYATVQEMVANKLMAKSKIHFENVNIILEIGAGTGFLTRQILAYYQGAKIIVNDIYDIRKYIEKQGNMEFLLGDINKILLPQGDLVISSSALQWVEDLDILFSKLARNYKYLSVAFYIEDNLREIKKHFGNSLPYYSYQEVMEILKTYFKNVEGEQEEVILNFSSPKEVLNHLKNTGVTGSIFKRASIKDIRSFKDTTCTYKIGYFMAKK